MKNTILLCLLTINSFAQSTDPSPYCAPPKNSSTTYNKGGIINVKIGSSFSNPTGLNTASPQYTYYNNLPAPNIYKGHENFISVTFDSVSKNGDPNFIDNSYYSVWIDYNNDAQFQHGFNGQYSEIIMSDTTSGVDKFTSPDGGIITISASFTPPDTSYTGVVRMRVVRTNRCQALTDGINYEWQCDCGYTGNIGESEDYNVNLVIGTPPITGTSTTSMPGVLIYPNPTSGMIHISNLPTPHVRIHNMVGAEVYDGTTSDVDMSGMPNGVYVANINDAVYKIVKQ